METLKKAGVRVAVAEIPGCSAKSKVRKSDPFRSRECGDVDKCMVCAMEGGVENADKQE